MRHFLKYDLIPVLSMGAVCAFPVIFMYARNAGETTPGTMLPFLAIFGLTALLLFGLCSVFLHNVSRSAFLTDLMMLVVINFCLVGVQLRKVLPFLRDRYLLALALVVLLAIFLWLLRKKPDLRTGCLLVLIAFGSMILVNSILAVPALLNAHQVQEELKTGGPQEIDLSGVAFQTQDRPNVYLFLFDEYGGYENLQHYYDYDNGPFLDSLAQRGFTVAYDSHNTEAIHTDTIMPNLLNLNYVVKVEESGHKKKVFRNNCQLYQMFAANGYQINLINHVDYLGTAGCRVLTTHQTRRTISEYLLRNSIFNKSMYLRSWGDYFSVSDYAANYRASLDNAMDVSRTCYEETGDTPTLTIGYIQSPHSPTMVGPNGEDLPFATGWAWRDHSLYLGQLEYTNKFISDLVDGIQQHDPDALILLLSDHGNRYALHMVQIGEWETYDPKVENVHMQNVLSCVYYQGQTFDIEHKTGINTIRTVVNQVFGTHLPEIPPVQTYVYEYQDEKS